MKLLFSVLSAVLILLLLVCGRIAAASPKTVGKYVAMLNFLMILPLTGSLIINHTHQRGTALFGNYLYFIGISCIVAVLMKFAAEYCKNSGTGHRIPVMNYILIGIDTVQILLNPFTGHVFDVKQVSVDGLDYYRLVSRAGLMFHRIVDYSIFGMILLIFIVMTIRMPRIYKEKYSVIMGTFVFTGIWQTVCIFADTSVDHSTIGYGISGIVIFYFSLCYRPLKLLDSMLSDIISEMPESLFILDPNGKYIWANELGCQMADIRHENFDHTEKKLTELFGSTVRNSGNWSSRTTVTQNGELKYYVLESRTFTDETGRITGSYLRIRDITREQQALREKMYKSTHDQLTGLYTREYLFQNISELFREHPDGNYLIVFINVKNFKIVNDVFGNAFGNYALRCIADTLRQSVSESSRYGRLSGDTFGICMPEPEFHAGQIEKELSRFVIKQENKTHQLLIHLGVYKPEDLKKDISVMFDRAHLALSSIQDEYKTHIAFYNKELREQTLWKQNISAQLPEALAKRQLLPYLQPIADRDGNIVGAEALARWIHPEYGFMPPGSFIPVFEKNGMIAEVDRHIWKCACEILAAWRKQNRNLFISVNISPKDFYFIDVLEEITGLVKEYAVPPVSLRIEITETIMMNDAENRMQILENFRKAGFIVEMDDFGSGYSSLNMLKDMPVDVLKIDMKFLSRTGDREKAKTIVRNIIHLSEELGISALTEGVETKEQYQALSEMGCSLFQGYYFSKPLPEAEFEKLL